MASIPVPTPVPVKSVADILSRLADCKDDAQRLRDSTPSIDYHAMDQLKKQTGEGRGWDVFVIWYPRLLRNLRDIAAGLRGSSSVTVQDNERVAIGEKWDNFLKYFTQAISGTNSGCLKTNEMRIKFGPLVLPSVKKVSECQGTSPYSSSIRPFYESVSISILPPG